jgi:hypothetical protein
MGGTESKHGVNAKLIYQISVIKREGKKPLELKF